MFTNNYDEHVREGSVMCWPFEIVSWPHDMPDPRPELVAITFDGTVYSVYEYIYAGSRNNTLRHQPNLIVTNITSGVRAQMGIIDFLQVDRYGETVATVPVYQFNPPQDMPTCMWRDGMEMSYLTLGDGKDIIIVPQGETSLYFLRRRHF